MIQSNVTVTTTHGSRYLQQLCKHWQHRFDVTFDPASGRVDFGEDMIIDLTSNEGQLSVTVSSPTDDGTRRLEQVLEDHLKRFAFREDLSFAWSRA